LTFTKYPILLSPMANKLYVLMSFSERNRFSCSRPLHKIGLVFLTLFFLSLPSSGIAQSYYYQSGYTDGTSYYPAYNSQYQQYQSYNPSPAPSYSYSQVAGVAAAFSPTAIPEVSEVPSVEIENPPQLPKTGGGGKAIQGKSQTNPFINFSSFIYLLMFVTLFCFGFVLTRNT